MRLSTTISVLLMSASASLVVADNCFGPWNWCGWSLIKKGNYKGYIKNKLAAKGLPVNDWTINNSIFRCLGNTWGDADFLAVCTHGCAYGGNSNSNDYCVQNRILSAEEGKVTVAIEDGEEGEVDEWIEGQAH